MTVQGVRVGQDGAVTVDGAVPIRDLNRVMDWSLPVEATTVAGPSSTRPKDDPGTRPDLHVHGFRFEVLRKTRNRVTQFARRAAAARLVPGWSAVPAAGRPASRPAP